LSSDKSAGVITAVLADAGQVVSAGQAVIRLARPEEKEVAIAVPESRLSRVEGRRPCCGQPVGRAKKYYSRANYANLHRPPTRRPAHTPRASALIDPPPAVQLGMTARVVFGAAPNTTSIVPLNAVTDQGSGAQVWVVRMARPYPRKVQVAQFSEHGALIDSGLKEGER
jgi:multidrug efflux system membrane fusion protein